MEHISVLLHEVIDGLGAQKGDTILDATLGGGGHSEALCKSVGSATFVCLDADEDAIDRSGLRLAHCSCTFHFYRTNFRHLDVALKSFAIEKVDRVLFDLGLSSYQLDTPPGTVGRGFSFRGNEPLRMTYEKIPPAAPTTPSRRLDTPPQAGGEDSAPFTKGRIEDERLTAEQIVNEWDEENIATVIESYGEEPQAYRIARAIVEARAVRPIKTSSELREVIERAIRRKGKIHPATKTFQALRMTVNDELRALEEGLRKAWVVLAPGGRIAVISFHSLEDRFVKNFFRNEAKAGTGKLLTKKPIVPAREEIVANPRSRSAKLRIIEKV